jgi:hypothetical protein
MVMTARTAAGLKMRPEEAKKLTPRRRRREEKGAHFLRASGVLA